MAGLKGTPEQRREVKEALRRANRAVHIRQRAEHARDGHGYVKAATLAALAVSKRLDEDGRQRLAGSLIDVIQRFDHEGTP